MERLRALLESLRSGESSVEGVLDELRQLPFEDLGFAKLDHHRELRRGFPEVVFGPGKTPDQIKTIAEKLAGGGQRVLVTKTSEKAFDRVAEVLPEATWFPEARAIVVGPVPKSELGPAAILCAGTSDIPVAEEAALTAELMGAQAIRLYDVGVAGLHRLLAYQKQLRETRVQVVVAGMEGALPSVVSGLTASPVVAVPTSVGYGASFGGLAALLAMLNGCSPGVSVVNIDNGFGAGYLAGLICRGRPG